ncbi:MAG: energy transducer TonB [Roseivirga sp.]|nr:energy transducer TonB [Roseivirga sp.]
MNFIFFNKLTKSLLTCLLLVFTTLCLSQPPQRAISINEIDDNGNLQGEWIFLDENGNIFLNARYVDSRPIDTLTFFRDGNEFLKLLEIEKGKILFYITETKTAVIRTVENKRFIYRLKNGTAFNNTDQFKPFLESQAQFPKGEAAFLKFQSENLRYPPTAVKKKTEGAVTASFLIRKDGSVDDIKIIKGLSRKCDKEVLRVLKLMPNWQPGLQRGHPITSRISVAINFKL